MVNRTFRTQFLHFDSVFASYIIDVNNTSGSTQNSYKAVYSMNQTFKNIKRVYLTAVELPFTTNNIKTGSTDNFRFVFNGTTFSYVIPEVLYTSASLALAINNVLHTPLNQFGVGNYVSFGYDGNNKAYFNFTGGFDNAAVTFSLTETLLSKNILGFRSTDTVTAPPFPVYTASMNYNLALNSDPYCLMYIPTLNGLNASQSGKQSTFKIPMNIQSTGVNPFYYHLDAKTFKQFVDITDPQLTISNLTVIMYDRYGSNLNPYGKSFSFTLALELWD